MRTQASVAWWVGVLAACAPPSGDGPTGLDGPLLLMATTADDYSTGGLAALALDDPSAGPVDVSSLHGDAVVRVVGGRVVAINRLGMDTLRIWDDLEAPPSEVSMGRGSNPHDVVVVGDRWLVSRYEEPDAYWLDPQTAEQLGALDLSGQADGDGIPEMSSMVSEGDAAWIALHRLDRLNGWTADPLGRVVQVDGSGIVATVDVGPNPGLVAHPDGGALVLADDGLSRLHADGRLEGPVTHGLGTARIVDAVVADDGAVAAIVRNADQHAILCLDRWDGAITSRSDERPQFFSDLAIHGDTVWVAARRGWEDPTVAGGLFGVDRSDCGAIPDPEGWLRSTFAPYGLAVRGNETP